MCTTPLRSHPNGLFHPPLAGSRSRCICACGVTRVSVLCSELGAGTRRLPTCCALPAALLQLLTGLIKASRDSEIPRFMEVLQRVLQKRRMR